MTDTQADVPSIPTPMPFTDAIARVCTTRLAAYEALGTPEYLAALADEHEADGIILRAIRDMGRRPDIHKRAVDWLEKHWPTLWSALCQLASAHDEAERLRDGT